MHIVYIPIISNRYKIQKRSKVQGEQLAVATTVNLAVVVIVKTNINYLYLKLLKSH